MHLTSRWRWFNANIYVAESIYCCGRHRCRSLFLTKYRRRNLVSTLCAISSLRSLFKGSSRTIMEVSRSGRESRGRGEERRGEGEGKMVTATEKKREGGKSLFDQSNYWKLPYGRSETHRNRNSLLLPSLWNARC